MDAKATWRQAPRWIGTAACAAWLALGAGIAAAQSPAVDDEPPARVGRIADLGGDVYHAPEDRASDWSTIGQNYPIASGDNLWVADGGRAEIDVGAGQIRLGGGSNVHIARLDDRTIAFFLAQGQAILRLRVLDPGEVARIDTPNTQVALTRPGLYRVDVSPDRLRTTVVVREGEATLPTQGGMQQVLPGQTALAEGLDATYVDVRNGIATDGFDTWSANRDRRYERSRSAQYVSRQMVGYADLDDHGRWESDTTYGAVWYPTQVDPDWAPYRDGYWTTVPVYGYTWVDNAPWGYAPFHYGRWVHNHGRWGWCPGAYVARPRWSPAMVGWVGGTGWQLGASFGTPVYGWVPLAWGEAFRPWWSTCSNRCWDHYNRPYSVRTDERTRRAPALQYANINRPGGITAVRSDTFGAQKPLRGNLVTVSPTQVASAPSLSAPPASRSGYSHVPLVKPGTANTPQPASTMPSARRGNPIALPAFPVPSRSVTAPSTAPTPVTVAPGATRPGSKPTPDGLPRNYHTAPAQQPSPPPASVPPPTRYSAPVQRETAPAYVPPQRAMPSQPAYTAPVQRETAPAYVPPPRAAPSQPAYTAPVQRGTVQTYVPPPQRAVAPVQVAPPPQQQPAPVTRTAPPPAPVAQQVPPPAAAPQVPPPQSTGGGGRAGYNDGGRGGPDGGGDRGPGNKPGYGR